MIKMNKQKIKLTQKLKDWLKLYGWTQKQLADYLDVDESLVSRWFAGTRLIDMQSISKLCILTRLSVGELVSNDGSLIIENAYDKS